MLGWPGPHRAPTLRGLAGQWHRRSAPCHPARRYRGRGRPAYRGWRAERAPLAKCLLRHSARPLRAPKAGLGWARAAAPRGCRYWQGRAGWPDWLWGAPRPRGPRWPACLLLGVQAGAGRRALGAQTRRYRGLKTARPKRQQPPERPAKQRLRSAPNAVVCRRWQGRFRQFCARQTGLGGGVLAGWLVCGFAAARCAWWRNWGQGTWPQNLRWYLRWYLG